MKITKQILDHANSLDPDLKKILDNELKLGNKISSASSDYPDVGSIPVTLAEELQAKYKIKKVQYSKINDPHYWSEYYMSLTDPRHRILY